MEGKNKKISKIIDFHKSIKKTILDMSLEAGASSAHIGGALSISDVVSVLFGNILNYDEKNKDRFILSKGHACLAYYAALFEIGKINLDDIKSFEKDNSKLPGHPVKNKELGIDFSNGSLGMGLSIGIGLAIANKKKNKNSKIYVILGDGECNEGSVWEAALSAPKFNLDNLVVIIDKNNFQQTGSNSEIMDLGDLKKKWLSFKWEVNEIDGHNLSELLNYFENLKENKIPKVLIANTTKGKGFTFSENKNEWHHSVMTKNIYEKALKEIK
jgi:transketolase